MNIDHSNRQLQTSNSIAHDEVITKFEQSAAKWREISNLIRKCYLFDIDRRIAGGVYLWKKRIHAEIWLGAEFKKIVKDNYGDEPSLQFFETPIVVDNFTSNILK